MLPFKELVLNSNDDATAFGLTVTLHVAVLSPAEAEIVVSPTASAVMTPFSTVATEGFELFQVTVLSVASSGNTVAVSVAVLPSWSSMDSSFKEMLVTGMSFF